MASRCELETCQQNNEHESGRRKHLGTPKLSPVAQKLGPFTLQRLLIEFCKNALMKGWRRFYAWQTVEIGPNLSKSQHSLPTGRALLKVRLERRQQGLIHIPRNIVRKEFYSILTLHRFHPPLRAGGIVSFKSTFLDDASASYVPSIKTPRGSAPASPEGPDARG